jgi:lambda family phage portal protein
MSPGWGQKRALARLKARHYEAATTGRRTDGWSRRHTDANAAASGATLANLRAQARDLTRNNPWARNALRVIANDVVGWGIRAKAKGRDADVFAALWKQWAETKQCDANGRNNFYGLQWLVMRTVAESGECLIRLRKRRIEDGLAIPMQLQVLEPDYIDTGKDGIRGEAGGMIVQGIEHDALGRRAAYWLFDQHPGSVSSLVHPVSRRIPAAAVIHVFDQERPGQVRGPSWFASVDVRLHEFDEYEDATLMKQKIASCMAAFVTDLDGQGTALGQGGTDRATGLPTDTFEPGMIMNLPPGKQVTVAQPPAVNDHQSFSAMSLRGAAAGVGVTYESLTGDYSNVNYSSARMGRNVYAANVNHWRWMMLVPQFCEEVWAWAVAVASIAGPPLELEPATWTPSPLPMLDPEKESAAATKAVRSGQMTHDEMVREQGYDPDEFWAEYAAGVKRLAALGIVLDSDPTKMSQGGQPHPSAPAAAPASASGAKPAQKKPAPEQSDDDEPEIEVVIDEDDHDTADDKKSGGDKPGDKAAAAEEVKRFAYHQPFMKVKEIRQDIDLDPNVKDSELFAGEWLAKYGGKSTNGGDDSGGEGSADA